jgi:adenylosuccinate synthase
MSMQDSSGSRQPPPGPPHTVVTGLQWGDEGKGKIVDWLTESFDLVVRYNGGANAGHSVVIGPTRYALHLVPCGILRPGVLNLIANGVVVDPEQLLSEIEGLEAAGLPVDDRLKLSDRAHLVLPYHKRADGLLEAAVAVLAGEGSKVGTTGRGIGPCYADKATRTTAIRVADLYQPEELRLRLGHIAAVKNATLGALAELAGDRFEPLDADLLFAQLTAIGERLRPYVVDTAMLIHQAMDEGRRVLFEGGNGSLLDVDHGSYPYVTSSHTTALGIHAGAGVPAAKLGRVVGIVKAYTTRVGAGPCPTELENAIGEHLRIKGREFGTTTGRPRRCGWLDLVAVDHSARLSGATEVALMLMDVLAGLDELKICTGYRLDGRLLEGFPASASDLERVEPAYESLPGFSQEIDQARAYADLPATARAYVERVEEILGVRISMVSVGPERSQTLLR